MAHRNHHTHWILWPVVALWKLISLIVEITGRLLAVVIGAVLLLAGGIISLTIIGAILGIPLAILGLLIILRGLF
jgi:hypothetical protein